MSILSQSPYKNKFFKKDVKNFYAKGALNVSPDISPEIFLHHLSRHHHLAAASSAFHPKIHSDPDQFPLVGTAGMRFLHFNHITDLKIHFPSPQNFFLPLTKRRSCLLPAKYLFHYIRLLVSRQNRSKSVRIDQYRSVSVSIGRPSLSAPHSKNKEKDDGDGCEAHSGKHPRLSVTGLDHLIFRDDAA